MPYLALFGRSGLGKTVTLEAFADEMGMVYESLDCLYHLNFKAMRKLFLETIFKEKHEFCKLVEVVNFDKYQTII